MAISLPETKLGRGVKSIRHILVALPTVSRGMKSNTAISVAQAVAALQANGVATTLHNIDSAEIVTARDMFANMLLHTPQWDALLFVDSDMGFQPSLILRMLAQDAEVVAAACPRRTLDLAKLIQASNAGDSIEVARSRASDFTVLSEWGDRKGSMQVRDGFVSAAAAGMAIAIISKTALQAMVAGKVVERRLDLNSATGAPCWSFFGILAADGTRLGEDYSFCYRWTKLLGRKLPVCVDETVSHMGDFEYRGRFADVTA